MPENMKKKIEPYLFSKNKTPRASVLLSHNGKELTCQGYLWGGAFLPPTTLLTLPPQQLERRSSSRVTMGEDTLEPTGGGTADRFGDHSGKLTCTSCSLLLLCYQAPKHNYPLSQVKEAINCGLTKEIRKIIVVPPKQISYCQFNFY